MNRPLKIPQQVHKFFYIFIKQFSWQCLCVALAAVVSSVSVNTIWPYITGNLIDTLSKLEGANSTLSQVLEPIFLLLLFWCCIEAVNRIKGFGLSFTMPRFESSMRMSLFSYVAKQPYSYFIHKPVGSVAQRIDDIPRSARYIMNVTMTMFLPFIATVLSSSGIFFTMHPVLSIIFPLFICTYIASVFFFGLKSSKLFFGQSGVRAKLQDRILDVIRNIITVKVFSATQYEIKDTESLQKEEAQKYKASLIYVEKSKIMLSLINLAGLGILLFVAIMLWQQQSITLGNFVFIVHSSLNIIISLWYMTDEIGDVFIEIGLSQKGLGIILDGSNKEYGETNLPALNVSKGKIEFHNVTFNHRNGRNLFLNKSLVIEGGTKVGLVGFSGSGKTTFTQLITRLYEPNAGSIYIDAQDISRVDKDSLRRKIALIQQDPVLFHRSIRENIRYGKLSMGEKEILDASVKAHCDEFVQKFPEGYNTLVGETGSRLSGGQRQRVAIARAILKNAPILIMDEATSALDSATEESVQRSLEYLMKDKTVLIIAHRFSTLTRVDRLLVFNNGVIIEDGSHEELLAKCGYYSMLWNAQKDKLIPDGN